MYRVYIWSAVRVVSCCWVCTGCALEGFWEEMISQVQFSSFLCFFTLCSRCSFLSWGFSYLIPPSSRLPSASSFSVVFLTHRLADIFILLPFCLHAYMPFYWCLHSFVRFCMSILYFLLSALFSFSGSVGL